MSSALPAVPDSIGFRVDGLQLYTDVDPTTGLHYLQCNRCSEVITLTVTGNPRNFIRHQEGNSCPRLAKSRGLSHPAFERPSRLHVPAFSTAPSSLFSEGPSARLPAIISSFSRMHAHSPTPPPETPSPQSSHFHVPDTSDNNIPSIIITAPPQCPGVEVPWSPGSIWSTYPYHQHKLRSLGWRPTGFIEDENKILLRSDQCQIDLSESENSPCIECQVIPHSLSFQNFMEKAEDVKENTPWDYLTHEQLVKIMKKMSQQLKTLRTKVRRLYLIYYSPI